MKTYTAQNAIDDGLDLIKQNTTGDLDQIVEKIIDRVRDNPRALELDITDIIPKRYPNARYTEFDPSHYLSFMSNLKEWILGPMSESHFYVAEKLLGLGFDLQHRSSDFRLEEKTVIQWFKFNEEQSK